MRGFSLIEVMLVTLLLTVLGAMGWPALQRNLWQQQLYSSAEQIYAAIRDARLQAIASGEDQWFGFSKSGELCFWQTERPPQSCAPEHFASGTASQRVIQQPPELINIATNFSPIPAVRFSALNGMAGFSAGRFQISHSELSDQSIRVIISTLGRIRICIAGTHNHRFAKC
ncbi:hypothetical protein CWE13_05370 [Aliidiomarina shirensis]|uniref:Type II secretion system protein H n=1 Tax=Aliidiomarina shirensis TaxID=1048642 RepID=A0A432WUD8_9GAMM|nr:GspH/FimT family protein [Aliidiomarina shirensis]RUO37390.1 hypothetical protein CWE13_05370 [Aliidiomarina shirensis]